MILWRISVHATLEGLGGLRWPGRWHLAGQPIVYLADHPASCMLETLAHLETAKLPATFSLLQVAAPDEIIQALAPESLSENWRQNPAETQAIGQSWLAARAAALLRVPSAIAPEAWNFLLNPLHPDAKRCVITQVRQPAWDPRLRP